MFRQCGPENNMFRPFGLSDTAFRPCRPKKSGFRPCGPKKSGFRLCGPKESGIRPRGPRKSELSKNYKKYPFGGERVEPTEVLDSWFDFADLCSNFEDLSSHFADLCSDPADFCSDFADFGDLGLHGDYEFLIKSDHKTMTSTRVKQPLYSAFSVQGLKFFNLHSFFISW